MLISDKFLESIVEPLREKAEAMLHPEYSPKDLDELVIQLRFWYSKHYNIPMFHPMLESFSIKDMLFEYYLHNSKPPSASDVIFDKKDELADMIAEEWGDADDDFLNEVADEMKQSASWSEKF